MEADLYLSNAQISLSITVNFFIRQMSNNTEK